VLEISAGDTAWVLASAALVLLMTPGLAFFYGGMVRAKGALNMIMMSFISMGTIGVLWVLSGYSMAFGDSMGFSVPTGGLGTKPMRPHNMTLVMLGAGLLWFGWFGFDSGSAIAAMLG